MTAPSAMRVLIIEDEVLVATEIEMIVGDVGMAVVGVETSSKAALAALAALRPDLVLLDVHLADGPTGVELGRVVAESGAAVLFMTANRRRLPADFAGAIGAVAKPYTEWGLRAALRFLSDCLAAGEARRPAPASLELAPDWSRTWSATGGSRPAH